MILYVYAFNSSQANKKHFDYIKNELMKIYGDIQIIPFDNLNEDILKNTSILIFSGGDGIFNHIINKCVDFPRIILGYIPLGTANDIGHNFGIRNISDGLAIIKNNKVKEYTLLEVNNHYFMYALSAGVMSKVSYNTKRIEKKYFHKIIYKLKGIKYMFLKKSFIRINCDEVNYDGKYKTVIVSRTKYLGGVNIRRGEVPQTLSVIFIRSIWDLVQLFIFKHPKEIISNVIEINNNEFWCVDGEKIDFKLALIKESNKKINLLSKNT